MSSSTSTKTTQAASETTASAPSVTGSPTSSFTSFTTAPSSSDRPLFASQLATIAFAETTPLIFDMSDPGTGKTRAHLEIFRRRRQKEGGKCLVLAPKSILQPAWGNDASSYAPELRYSIAPAEKRAKAFAKDADLYITNHDAVKFLVDNKHLLEGFSTIIVDESTAFKHHTSQRSKALRHIIPRFHYRELLSGSPNPNGILDLWHQALLLDGGQRLGASYFKFRAAVCEPVQVGPSRDMVDWVDKPGIELAVAQLLADITVRHRLEDCHDLPENVTHRVIFDLSPAHRRAYDQLKKTAILALESGGISPIHTSTLGNKLLQLASGAVYDNARITQLIASERYALVAQLAAERGRSLIAYNWDHQLQHLLTAAKALGLRTAYINGSVPGAERSRIVDRFQAGQIDFLPAHPAAAAHGLTLTRGRATIWASPTSRAEFYQQFNRRIYRAGQDHRTETIEIVARDTLEGEVYNRLQGHLDPMASLLEYLS